MKIGDKVIAIAEYRLRVHGAPEDATCIVKKGSIGAISCLSPVLIDWGQGVVTYGRAEQYRIIRPVYCTADEASKLGYEHNGMLFSDRQNAEWAVQVLMEQGKDAVLVPIKVAVTVIGYGVATRGGKDGE